MESPFYGILENKTSPVIPTFLCPKFPTVQSLVPDVPSPGISFPSVNHQSSSDVHRRTQNDTIEVLQPEAKLIHSEEHISEIGDPKQES
ncbi:hypothetical protein O181_049782 [Austropuccinia psidii MF-1]|uniref:Uncharacterized protein n=1 Tax=Austropuccinia psidii MF-1 TaxID=1389203 RepID=A0A9Q3DXN8_9BASI|nr:hypothetical protein [Austropuccinia psidii MF-1]